jgi:hypothetical protein
MSTFVARRLSQMSPLGAIVHMPLQTGNIHRGTYKVSTVEFARERWTRVVRPDEVMVHFRGELDNHEAVVMALRTYE